MRLVEFGDVDLARLVEGGGGEDQDRGVDGQREHQCDRGIGGRQLDRFALVLDAIAEAARLHHAGVQIEIVRHHCRANDADGEIKHVGIGHDLDVVGAKPRITAPQSGSAIAICTTKQTAITPSSVTMKASIQRKPRFCIHRIRNTSSAVISDADLERYAEKQVESDGGADDFGQVGGADRDFGQHPERP